VILTLRTADLASHAGQIAFPGGKIDPATEARSAPRCASRGGDRPRAGVVEPLGYLDLYLTFSGSAPADVARVAPAYALNLNKSEVARRSRSRSPS